MKSEIQALNSQCIFTAEFLPNLPYYDASVLEKIEDNTFLSMKKKFSNSGDYIAGSLPYVEKET